MQYYIILCATRGSKSVECRNTMTLQHWCHSVATLQHQHYDTAYKKMAYKIHPCKIAYNTLNYFWNCILTSSDVFLAQKSPIWRSGARQVAKLAVLVVSKFLNAFQVILKCIRGFLHQCRSVVFSVVVLQHQHWCHSVAVL